MSFSSWTNWERRFSSEVPGSERLKMINHVTEPRNLTSTPRCLLCTKSGHTTRGDIKFRKIGHGVFLGTCHGSGVNSGTFFQFFASGLSMLHKPQGLLLFQRGGCSHSLKYSKSPSRKTGTPKISPVSEPQLSCILRKDVDKRFQMHLLVFIHGIFAAACVQTAAITKCFGVVATKLLKEIKRQLLDALPMF